MCVYGGAGDVPRHVCPNNFVRTGDPVDLYVHIGRMLVDNRLGELTPGRL